MQATLDELDVPWSISQLGARAEYRFARPAPTTGEASAAAADDELDAYMHLAMVNRGILMTPFHNMALMCPETSREDVERHTQVFREVVGALFDQPRGPRRRSSPRSPRALAVGPDRPP